MSAKKKPTARKPPGRKPAGKKPRRPAKTQRDIKHAEQAVAKGINTAKSFLERLDKVRNTGKNGHGANVIDPGATFGPPPKPRDPGVIIHGEDDDAPQVLEAELMERVNEDRGDNGSVTVPHLPHMRSTLQELAERIGDDRGISDLLYDNERIELITRLNPEMVVSASTGIMVARQHRIPELEDWIIKIMELRVSLAGEGRKEAVEIGKGHQMGMDPFVAQRMK